MLKNNILPPTVIGIAGGIGSGKSVVSRVLRCNGFEVYDCDHEAKHIMENDPQVQKALIDRFGESIYLQDGKLNRAELSQKIFTNAEERKYVNKVVHQAVRDDIKGKERKAYKFFFIESAIIVTGGIDKLCDCIWVIESPLDERIRRVINRDNTDEDSIRKRIKAQQHEISEIPSEKIIYIDNEKGVPLLPIILKLTEKLNNNQTYTISC